MHSEDPDQMPHYAASDQGLHCLLRPVCPITSGKFGNRDSQGHLYLVLTHLNICLVANPELQNRQFLQEKITYSFLTLHKKHMLWVLIRSAS